MKQLLAGLMVALAPLALSGQGIRVSSVIPTQTLIQKAAAFPRLPAGAPRVVAVVPPPMVSCDMPVSRPVPGTAATDAGGIQQPPNRAGSIPIMRSACVNRMAQQAPDGDLLKKQ